MEHQMNLPFDRPRFSALQRAEIAEIKNEPFVLSRLFGFSALQRAEIAEIHRAPPPVARTFGFSALQRAEIAEIPLRCSRRWH